MIQYFNLSVKTKLLLFCLLVASSYKSTAQSSNPYTSKSSTRYSTNNINTKKNIFWASQPVLPDETVMIAGDNLQDVQFIQVRRVDKNGIKTSNKVGFQTVKPLQASQESLKFILPATLQKGIFECRFIGTDWQQTIFLNEPDVWWWQGDQGTFATTGGWLRAFGKSLNLDPTSKVLLTDNAGNSFTLKTSPSDGFSLFFSIPTNLIPGKYQVTIKNSFAPLSNKVTEIEIKKSDLFPQTVFNVMDYYGQDSMKEILKTVSAFDKPINRNQAIDAALKKASDNGGGIIYFPEGKYAYEGQLKVPPHTTLKGAGMGVAILRFGTGDFSIDGGSRNRRINDSSDEKAAPPVLITGDDYHLQDLSIYFPRHFNQGIASGDGFQMERVRIRIDRFWVRSGKLEHDLLMSIGNNCRIKDCDIVAQGNTLNYKGKGEWITNNTIMAGNLVLGMCGSNGAIIEDNKFTSIDPQAYINLNEEGRNIYYARNTNTAQFAQESDFGFTFDGMGQAYLGKVAATEESSITLANNPKYPDWANEQNDLWNHSVAAIIDGKGTGQYRLITARSGRHFQLENPFEISPDTSSILSVIPFRGHILIVGNRFEDTHWLNMGWGSSFDIICANNQVVRASMFLSEGMKSLNSVQPSWYVQYLHNDVIEGHTIVQNYGGPINSPIFSGLVTRFCIHRGTHLHSDNSGNIEIAGDAKDVILEHCILDNQYNQILLKDKVSGVLLRNNLFSDFSLHYGGNCLSKALVFPALK